MHPSVIPVKNQLGGVHAIRASPPGRDPSGFWKTTGVEPGRGYSCTTSAETLRPNGAQVLMEHYTPGPFDLIAFGPESPLSTPSSTYFVYTGIDGQPDKLSKAAGIVVIKKVHPNVQSCARGVMDVWSPDGEGALFLRFAEKDMDAAFAFADSLEAVVFAPASLTN